MGGWQDGFRDPNHPELLDLRRAEIASARQDELIFDRIAYLCDLAKEKDVLDIGIVEHFIEAFESPAWLHRHIARSAASCIGVDLLEEEVAQLSRAGFNVVVADIADRPLDRQFDLIIAGEVLEHVDAPGNFVKNCAGMLRPTGRLALTVPNPWYINAMVKSSLRARTFVDSADHVGWYDASTLVELGRRSGLKLMKYSGIGVRNSERIGARLFFGMRPVMTALGVSPFVFAKSVIYEFSRA
jgi:SAM-dependent methyltransferase